MISLRESWAGSGWKLLVHQSFMDQDRQPHGETWAADKAREEAGPDSQGTSVLGGVVFNMYDTGTVCS